MLWDAARVHAAMCRSGSLHAAMIGATGALLLSLRSRPGCRWLLLFRLLLLLLWLSRLLLLLLLSRLLLLLWRLLLLLLPWLLLLPRRLLLLLWLSRLLLLLLWRLLLLLRWLLLLLALVFLLLCIDRSGDPHNHEQNSCADKSDRFHFSTPPSIETFPV